MEVFTGASSIAPIRLTADLAGDALRSTRTDTLAGLVFSARHCTFALRAAGVVIGCFPLLGDAVIDY